MLCIHKRTVGRGKKNLRCQQSIRWAEWIRDVMSVVKDGRVDDERCGQLLSFHTWWEEWLAHIKKSHICSEQHVCDEGYEHLIRCNKERVYLKVLQQRGHVVWMSDERLKVKRSLWQPEFISEWGLRWNLCKWLSPSLPLA